MADQTMEYRIEAGPPYPEVSEVVEWVKDHGQINVSWYADTETDRTIFAYLQRLENESPALGFALDTDLGPLAAEYLRTSIRALRQE